MYLLFSTIVKILKKLSEHILGINVYVTVKVLLIGVIHV